MDEILKWLDAHIIYSAAAVVVGSAADDAAIKCARRSGQYNLIWTLNHYAEVRRQVPACISSAVLAAQIDEDLAAALRNTAAPPKACAAGVSVGGKKFPSGVGVSARTAQAYWLLHHPTCGIGAAFVEKSTAPAVIDAVFNGKWKRRRSCALLKATAELCGKC